MANKSDFSELPTSLVKSDEWNDLNEIEQHNFVSRLQYIQKICLKSHNWLHTPGSFEDPADYIDEVEQDLFINLSSGDTGRTFGPWLIHTSWTFNSAPSELLAALPRSTVEALSNTDIGFDCNESEFRAWLEPRIKGVKLMLDGFYSSGNFTSAVAHLIGMNISLCTLLAGVSKQRLNEAISE